MMNHDTQPVVAEVRMALASVAPVPLRLSATEQVLTGKALDRERIELARKTAVSEIQPISDLRSTAKYRTVVAGNLVSEFLERVKSGG
jgi:carbon-monoxide dehydrogenase medium subunit